MQVTITARHLDVSDDIKAYVDEKLLKLGKYNSKTEEARVIFSAERFNYISEITLTGKHLRLVAVEKDEDLKASFDKSFSNAEKQLKKFRSRVKKHRALNFIESLKRISRRKPRVSSSLPTIVKSNAIADKPMSAEEAAMELELFKREFIVFRNAADERINVLYRQKDGNYGLIES
ncbi:ribosome hibernation-promoting factor, HPF/YfiA family [Candidatus Omnitrophota bacterium]